MRMQRGFTLLEILVVIGLMALLSLAVLVVPVWTDDGRQLDTNVAKLTDQLVLLNEQSLFSGRLMAMRFTERGWTPVEYDVGARVFRPAEGNGLSAESLPEGIELLWGVEELERDEDDRVTPVNLGDVAKRLVDDSKFSGGIGLLDKEQSEKDEQARSEPLPQVFFFPSGETTPVLLTLRSINEPDLEVRRRLTALGQIRDPDDAEAVREEEERSQTIREMRTRTSEDPGSLFNLKRDEQ